MRASSILRHWPSIAGMSPQSHCGDEEDGLETVLDLFSKCNGPVDPFNVKDCHPQKSTNNAPQKVIMKLSKRKDIEC